MKKITLIFALLISASLISAQENQITQNPETTQDSIFKTQHMLGINVFPAFGILGGGAITNSKIALQYKVLTKKINVRASLNYLNYYKNKNNYTLVGIVADTTLPKKPGEDTIFQSMKIRAYNNQVNTYDFRLGAEYAIDKQDYRFYFGLGGIVGIHNVANSYNYYYKPFTGYPIEDINLSFPEENNLLKLRTTNFLKLGLDLSLGVDFRVTDNWVIAIQYTPEFAYYKWLKSETKNDIDNIYTQDLKSFKVFSPDFIDLIIYIKF